MTHGVLQDHDTEEHPAPTRFERFMKALLAGLLTLALTSPLFGLCLFALDSDAPLPSVVRFAILLSTPVALASSLAYYFMGHKVGIGRWLKGVVREIFEWLGLWV